MRPSPTRNARKASRRRAPSPTRASGADERHPSAPALVVIGFLLFLLSLAVYWNSRDYAFVWDDLPYNLVGNSALMNGEYAVFWKRPYRDFFIPVSYSVWTWLAQGERGTDSSDRVLRPEIFRTANLLVHAVNTVLVFYLLFLLMHSAWAAIPGALLFAVHPVQVESVVWVSELRGLLATGFSLGALVLYTHWRRTGDSRVWFPILASIAFLLALLSKPSAAVLPVVAIAMDALLFREHPHRARAILPLFWLVPAAIVLVVTRSLQPVQAVEFHPSLVDRLFIVGDAAAFYVGKILVPYPLSPSYGRTPDYARSLATFHIVWLVPAIVCALAYVARRAQPQLLFAAILIAASLAPVSGIVPFKGQNFSTVADRYFYFPMLGVAVVVALAAYAARRVRPAVWATTAVLGGLLVFLNVRQQRIWRDELTLWSHITTAYPNQSRAHNNYGAALQVADRHAEAIEQFTLALKARPTFPDAHCNLGNSFGRMGNFRQALAEQTKALELDATDGGCWYNRAVTHYNLGQLQQSLDDLRRAEQHDYRVPESLKQAVQRRLGIDSAPR